MKVDLSTSARASARCAVDHSFIFRPCHIKGVKILPVAFLLGAEYCVDGTRGFQLRL